MTGNGGGLARGWALALIGLLAITVALADGCASGPVSKREKATFGGAALGAGAGAIIGSRTGDATGGALIGAALGGVTGAVAGDQLEASEQRQEALRRRVDEQEKQLQHNRRLLAKLHERNLDARNSERGVVVTLPDILFEFGSAELTRQARRTLRDIADVLLHQGRGRKLAVEGHTDSIGAELFNQGLSERRAARVALALVAEAVPERLIMTKGYGSKYPVAPNENPDGSDNPRGRRRNRRVEIVISN